MLREQKISQLPNFLNQLASNAKDNPELLKQSVPEELFKIIMNQ
jgi:hypothetical protein